MSVLHDSIQKCTEDRRTSLILASACYDDTLLGTPLSLSNKSSNTVGENDQRNGAEHAEGLTSARQTASLLESRCLMNASSRNKSKSASSPTTKQTGCEERLRAAGRVRCLTCSFWRVQEENGPALGLFNALHSFPGSALSQFSHQSAEKLLTKHAVNSTPSKTWRRISLPRPSEGCSCSG